ncbi:hypothetical protein [Caballeronia sp. RCC_10]|uniref:hypothetical protein n=1 Tax=Caballeronia sp. RCC_10 TaxID=3239227 RepID=UPI0035243DBC
MLPTRFIDGSINTHECPRSSERQDHAFADAINCERADHSSVGVENLEDFVPVPPAVAMDTVSVVGTAGESRRGEEQERNEKKQSAHLGLPSV